MFFDSLISRRLRTANVTPITEAEVEQTYFKMLGIHIAVSYIANTLSKCEFRVYENGKEVKNDLYYRLNVSPNPNQNASEFWNKVCWEMFCRNKDAGSLVINHGSFIFSADGWQVEKHPLTGDVYQNVVIGSQTLRKKFKTADSLLFKLDNKPVKSLIDGAFMQYEKAMAAAFSSFKARNGAKYKYSVDSYPGGTEQFQKDYKEFISGGLESFINSANSVLPLFKGTDIEMLQNSTQNCEDIIKLRKDVLSMEAQAFKIPESMMYGNVTNTNDVVGQYLTFGFDPYAVMIGKELTRKSFTLDEWKRGSYVSVDSTCVLHTDIFSVADKVDKLISCATANINEMRRRLQMPEIDEEWARIYWMTLNNGTAAQRMRDANNTTKNGGETNE